MDRAEDVVLSETSQTQKDKHRVIPRTRGPQRSRVHRDREEPVEPGPGEGRGVRGAVRDAERGVEVPETWRRAAANRFMPPTCAPRNGLATILQFS